MGLIAMSHWSLRRAQSEIGRASLRDILGPALNLAHNGEMRQGTQREATPQFAGGLPSISMKCRSVPLLH